MVLLPRGVRVAKREGGCYQQRESIQESVEGQTSRCHQSRLTFTQRNRHFSIPSNQRFVESSIRYCGFLFCYCPVTQKTVTTTTNPLQSRIEKEKKEIKKGKPKWIQNILQEEDHK